MILTIRTDKPEAEVALWQPDGTLLHSHVWHAHRELSASLLGVIRDELATQQASFADLSGIIVFKGPGSFTGLRIGVTVANTLAYGLQIPIVGTTGDHWQTDGLGRLRHEQTDALVLPEYGAEAHITIAKK